MSTPRRPPTRMTAATCVGVALLAIPILSTAEPSGSAGAPSGPRVSLGQYHSCAIDADGGLWCWGWNGCGQLGDGSTDDAIEPRRIGEHKDWTAIQAGERFTCGLRAPGTLWCWGKEPGARNCMQPAKDGKAAKLIKRHVSKPRRVGEDSDFRAVTAHHRHACAIKGDGSMWCWGENEGGQLGNGTKQLQTTPVRVGERSDWKQVSAGRDYTCGLTTDGKAWCWGGNVLGVLGNGTAKERTAPTPVAGEGRYSEISAGDYSTHALSGDGSVWQWGSSTNMRDGRRWMSPIEVGRDDPIVDLIAGFGCGLLEKGRLACWQGDDAFAAAAEGAAFRAVAVYDGNRACGLKEDGSLWCWGDDSGLMLGIQRKPLPPTRVGLDRYRTLTINDLLQTCAVRVDGSLWCWGEGDHTPVRQDGATDWAQYERNDTHTRELEPIEHGCKLDTAGTLRCWISGDAQTVAQAVEDAQVVQIGQDGEWDSVEMGSRPGLIKTCGLKKDTTIWCWDITDSDLPRRDFHAGYPQPVQIPGKGWAQVAVGSSFACGLKEDGAMWCWDQSDETCELKDGSKPMRLIGKWSRLGDSINHPFAIGEDGAVFVWTCHNQSWNRSTECGGSWARVAAGHGFCGIKTDGSLWAAPRPIRKVSDTFRSGAAIKRLGDDDWSAVAIGAFHACALKEGGALWCWGDNEWGGMGIGRPEHQRKPVRIPLGEK